MVLLQSCETNVDASHPTTWDARVFTFTTSSSANSALATNYSLHPIALSAQLLNYDPFRTHPPTNSTRKRRTFQHGAILHFLRPIAALLVALILQHGGSWLLLRLNGIYLCAPSFACHLFRGAFRHRRQRVRPGHRHCRLSERQVPQRRYLPATTMFLHSRRSPPPVAPPPSSLDHHRGNPRTGRGSEAPPQPG